MNGGDGSDLLFLTLSGNPDTLTISSPSREHDPPRRSTARTAPPRNIESFFIDGRAGADTFIVEDLEAGPGEPRRHQPDDRPRPAGHRQRRQDRDRHDRRRHASPARCPTLASIPTLAGDTIIDPRLDGRRHVHRHPRSPDRRRPHRRGHQGRPHRQLQRLGRPDRPRRGRHARHRERRRRRRPSTPPRSTRTGSRSSCAAARATTSSSARRSTTSSTAATSATRPSRPTATTRDRRVRSRHLPRRRRLRHADRDVRPGLRPLRQPVRRRHRQRRGRLLVGRRRGPQRHLRGRAPHRRQPPPTRSSSATPTALVTIGGVTRIALPWTGDAELDTPAAAPTSCAIELRGATGARVTIDDTWRQRPPRGVGHQPARRPRRRRHRSGRGRIDQVQPVRRRTSSRSTTRASSWCRSARSAAATASACAASTCATRSPRATATTSSPSAPTPASGSPTRRGRTPAACSTTIQRRARRRRRRRRARPASTC